MRTLLIASLLAFPLALLAQGQPKAPEQKPQTEQQQQEQKELLERTRVDGAAGGTAPVPEERRKPVNANAGPHKHKTTPSPAKLPRDEPVEPPK
jgi:hypothetical protein